MKPEEWPKVEPQDDRPKINSDVQRGIDSGQLSPWDTGLARVPRDQYVEKLDPSLSPEAQKTLNEAWFQPAQGREGNAYAVYDFRLPEGQPMYSDKVAPEHMDYFARHEMLHKLQFDLQPYSQDWHHNVYGQNASYGGGQAFWMVVAPHISDVMNDQRIMDPTLRKEAADDLSRGQTLHLWIALADAAMDPRRRELLPQDLQQYFQPLVAQ